MLISTREGVRAAMEGWGSGVMGALVTCTPLRLTSYMTKERRPGWEWWDLGPLETGKGGLIRQPPFQLQPVGSCPFTFPNKGSEKSNEANVLFKGS